MAVRTLPPAVPTLAQAPASASAPEPRRVLTSRLPQDRWSVVGAFAGALSGVWVLTQRVLPVSGLLGFWLLVAVAFVLLYGWIVAMQEDGRSVADRVATVLFTGGGLVVLAVLLVVIAYTFGRGFHAVLRLGFFTSTMASTGPLDPLTKGGVEHAIVGSLIQIAIAVLITVPLGIATAVFLSEVRGRFARPVRLVVDAMSAIPSIVAGLFVLATWILAFHNPKSGFAAALAISVMMLPIVVRTSEVVLRLVPGGLREASLALGASQWRTVWSVVLPTARSGLATAVVLGMARGIGETSPVLLTSGFASAVNTNPFRGPMLSLPLYIFTYARFPQAVMITRAYGAAVALLVVVLVLFVTARVIGGRPPGTLSARRRRRLEAPRTGDPT